MILEKIRLETAAGDLVAFEGILPMSTPPEMILWGSRMFMRVKIMEPTRFDHPREEVTTYREGLCVPIPVPLFYVNLHQRREP